jgi:hypothetical protein
MARDDGLMAAAGRLLYPLLRKQQDQADRERMRDQQLIIGATGEVQAQHQMEMQRRLKDAVETLTSETLTSRESSERVGGQLDSSAELLHELAGESAMAH